MLYFYLGLASIAVCVLHGLSYQWFVDNQNNALHQIIDYWSKDPINKAVLVDINSSCPNGLSQENIRLHFEGKSGLCLCEVSSDTYSTGTSTKSKKPSKPSYQECKDAYCATGYSAVKKIEGIDSADLLILFSILNSQNQQIKYKLCTSRIDGYSFDKQSPLKTSCNQDEKYCDWISSSSSTFDIDHGYCIPKASDCYYDGVQLIKSLKGLKQLPLIGFKLDSFKSQKYNIVDNASYILSDLLDLNNVMYATEYKGYLTDNVFLQTIHMPRVKARCRSNLQDTLSKYYGPEQARKVALALLIISAFSALLQFTLGILDLKDMTALKKSGCKYYYRPKRISFKRNSKIKNIALLCRPVLILIVLILNIVQITKYLIVNNLMDTLISDQCLDEYVSYDVGYNQIFNTSYYTKAYVYVPLGLSIAQFILDQNFYKLLRRTFKFIIRGCKPKTHLHQVKPLQQEMSQQQIISKVNNTNEQQKYTPQIQVVPFPENIDNSYLGQNQSTNQDKLQHQGRIQYI